MKFYCSEKGEMAWCPDELGKICGGNGKLQRRNLMTCLKEKLRVGKELCLDSLNMKSNTTFCKGKSTWETLKTEMGEVGNQM